MTRGEQIGMRVAAFLLGAGVSTLAVLVAAGVVGTHPDGLGWRLFFTVFCAAAGLHILGVAVFGDLSRPPTPGPGAVGFRVGRGGATFGPLDDVDVEDGGDD